MTAPHPHAFALLQPPAGHHHTLTASQYALLLRAAHAGLHSGPILTPDQHHLQVLLGHLIPQAKGPNA
jgi:hypothetical protein